MDDYELEEGVAPEGYETDDDPFNARMVRDKLPEPSPQRAALVKHWQERMAKAEKFMEPYFKKMREDQDFVAGRQWPNDPEQSNYVVNICNRHLRQKTAALYAKNPKAVAKVRPQMDHVLWDGRPQTLQAIQTIAQSGYPLDPVMQQVAQEATQTLQLREMRRRFARTLELVYDYCIGEQPIPFKKGMKLTVRRAIVNSVAYVKLDFIRVMQAKPEVTALENTIAERLAMITRLTEDIADGETDENAAEVEQLKLQLQLLQNEPEQVAREGLAIDYPKSDAILIDPNCQDLGTFLGAEWVAQKFLLTEDRIEEIYGIDVGHKYQAYFEDGRGVAQKWDWSTDRETDEKVRYAVVYEIWSKKDGQVFVICDGYPEFLQEPGAPDVWTERFYPFFPLVLNEMESEKDFIPPSDIRLMRPQQQEVNRCRQGLREHRIANRPLTVVAGGMIDEEDREKLQNRPANAVVELNGLAPQQDVNQLLQSMKPPGIDPNLYETNSIYEDMLHTVGTQPADMGGVSSDTTATEASIATSARNSSLGSEMDDMDDLLTQFARAAGQILLANLSEETVKKIVGPGAVWPRLSKQELANEVTLEIQAGSSGRPNQAQEISNMQTMLPLLMQIPGINPQFLAREALRRMDDRLDIEEALDINVPSIQAINQSAARPTQTPQGPEAQNPEAQGMEGANNAPQPEAGGPSMSQDQFPGPDTYA